ncbi:MAG: energy-coupling factor transporter transmembrane protein EcfT [Coriobacteriales bacterium]
MHGSAWSLYHPNAVLAYLAAVLLLTMAAPHPVLAGMSLAAACAYSFVVAGARRTLRMLAWQLPLLLLIAAANPLFSAAGSTELLRIGPRAFYAEALAYGFTTGSMLVAVMLWFSNADKVLNSDQVLMAGARVAPTVSLMVSMVLRLVPQFLQRGGQISDAQRACSAAQAAAATSAPPSKLPRFLSRKAIEQDVSTAARQVSVLMSWGMEDSLETADSLEALGWGSGRRSSYQMRRFRRRDGILLAAIALLAAASAAAAAWALGSFSFYPTISGWVPAWAYLPYLLLLTLPFALHLWEYLL